MQMSSFLLHKFWLCPAIPSMYPLPHSQVEVPSHSSSGHMHNVPNRKIVYLHAAKAGNGRNRGRAQTDVTSEALVQPACPRGWLLPYNPRARKREPPWGVHSRPARGSFRDPPPPSSAGQRLGSEEAQEALALLLRGLALKPAEQALEARVGLQRGAGKGSEVRCGGSH